MQTGGRERLITVDRVRSAMRRQELLIPRVQVEHDIAERIINDEPERARARGRLVLVPPLPPEPELEVGKPEVVVPLRPVEIA